MGVRFRERTVFWGPPVGCPQATVRDHANHASPAVKEFIHRGMIPNELRPPVAAGYRSAILGSWHKIEIESDNPSEKSGLLD